MGSIKNDRVYGICTLLYTVIYSTIDTISRILLQKTELMIDSHELSYCQLC